MSVFHNKKELWAEVNRLTPKQLEDGIYIDCPKDRRRRQAMGEKPVRLTIPQSVGKRFAIQIERYISVFKNKGIAWDVMTTAIEGPSNEILEGLNNERDDMGKASGEFTEG